MIPSNLENMGKCLSLIKSVQRRQLNHAISSPGTMALPQLHMADVQRVAQLKGKDLPLVFR